MKTRIIYIFGLLVLLVPMAEQQLQLVEKPFLHGYFVPAVKPELTQEAYISSAYQEQAEKYASENFGLRDHLLRFRNQVYFTVFDQSPNPHFMVGKNKYLYENPYVDAYFGNNFAGDSTLDDITDDIRKLQDTLAAHHVLLLTVIAPSKAYYNSENIPASYDLTPGDPNTNYASFRKYANSKKLNWIDFNEYYLEQKAKTPFPLYSKYGAHWTYYGATLAFDSILHKMSALTGRQFPVMKYVSSEIEINEHGGDNDIARTFNLMHVPDDQTLVVPHVRFEAVKGYVPNVLGITDSYYGVLYESGLLDSCFKSPDYWFYYKDKIPQSKYDTLKDKKDFLYSEIMSHEVIMLMCTPHNIHQLSWGFTQDALKVFDKRDSIPYKYDYYESLKIEAQKNYLSHLPEWYQTILLQAKNEHRDPGMFFERYTRESIGLK